MIGRIRASPKRRSDGVDIQTPDPGADWLFPMGYTVYDTRAGYTGRERADGSFWFPLLSSSSKVTPRWGSWPIGSRRCTSAKGTRACVDEEPWRTETDPTQPTLLHPLGSNQPSGNHAARRPIRRRRLRPAEPRRDKGTAGPARQSCRPFPRLSSTAASSIRALRPLSADATRPSPSRWVRSAAVDASIGWPVAKPGFAPLLQLLAFTIRSTDPIPFGGRHGDANAIQPPR